MFVLKHEKNKAITIISFLIIVYDLDPTWFNKGICGKNLIYVKLYVQNEIVKAWWLILSDENVNNEKSGIYKNL